MTLLKSPSGGRIAPYAVIPESHHPKGVGILISAYQGCAAPGRVAHLVEDLKRHNPPEIVDAVVNNLKEDFYEWCDRMQGKYGATDVSLEPGDLYPWGVSLKERFPNCVVTEEDTRTQDDYLEYPVPEHFGAVWLVNHPDVMKCRRKKPLKN